MSFLRKSARMIRLALHVISGFYSAARYRSHLHNGIPDAEFLRIRRAWMQKLVHILPLDIRCHGEAHAEPALWVANHVSWLDIPVIGSVSDVGFLSKAEVAEWPLVGKLAKTSGTLFIERGNAEAARVILTDLRNHLGQAHSVLVFPEGTTSDGTDIKPFRHRLLQAASEAGVAIQPVMLRYLDASGSLSKIAPYNNTETFLHSFWKIIGIEVLQVEVRFLPALHPAADISPRELAKELQQQLTQALRHNS